MIRNRLHHHHHLLHHPDPPSWEIVFGHQRQEFWVRVPTFGCLRLHEKDPNVAVLSGMVSYEGQFLSQHEEHTQSLFKVLKLKNYFLKDAIFLYLSNMNEIIFFPFFF